MTRAAAPRPWRCNGTRSVEKLVHTVTQQLVTLIDGADIEWALQLNLPPSLARGRPPDSEDQPRPATSIQPDCGDRLDELHHEARDRAWAAALRQRERYDLRAKRPSLHAGDQVWLFNPRRRVGRCTKLHSWWDGPSTIEAMRNDVVVRIRHPVHADRLALAVQSP